MLIQITNYTFNAAAKQITFTDYVDINITSIYSITNETLNGKIIFKKIDPTNYGGTVSGNVLTFTADNTGMSNGDNLLIQYQDDTIPPVIDANSDSALFDGAGNPLGSLVVGGTRAFAIVQLNAAGDVVDPSAGGGAAVWGSITGDIEDQTDLQNKFTELEEFAIAMAAAL